ncbi:MAG: B12-binding domain-containing radical SAM protein [Candidatus Omnitrophica bacterium]|nr:B12-binding domain-containing radical SAM protein [Candidatus Omnitrophota bacterium]
MRTLLVKPYNLSDHIQPSLGLGYLAAALRGKGHDTAILDCIKEGVRRDGLLDRVARLKPDVVGFQCYTFDLSFIKEALDGLKRLDRNIITVIGGPHPSAAPKESFGYFKDSLDFLFVGEAEKGLPLLFDKLEKKAPVDYGDIPGLAWPRDGDIQLNPQVFVNDLDSLGMPAWDLIRPEEYPESQHGAFFKKFPIAPIMVTRGCPYPCTFCAGNIVGGRRIRRHSIDFMLNQIKYLYDDRGIREFHVVDDNFTFDKDYAKEFLKKLIDLNLEMSWSTPNGVRIDTLDEELLRLMKESGLYLISLGIESGSDKVLKLMKKGTTVEKNREGVDLIRSAGIETAGFFIIGFPGETKEDIKRTIDFSLKLDLIRANYFTYLPFPGSQSFNELSSDGELDKTDWDRFYFMNAAFTPKGMTRSQLKWLQRCAFLRFYFRPRIFWKNLLGIKSFRHFWYLMKRFFHWIIMR